MIDRERLEELAEPVIEIYNEMQLDMLLNIAKRLREDKGALDDNVTEWQIRKLNQLNGITEDNIDVIARRSGVARESIEEAIRNAGFEGVRPNEDMLLDALSEGYDLTRPLPLGEDARILNILQTYQDQATDTLNLVNSTLLDQSEQVYRDILNRTTADVLSGTKSSQQALRDTVRQWSHKGIPALIDRRGRQWGAEGYIRMVTRTMSNRVTNDMQDERMDEWGVDLIEVSSHLDARELCAPYQGRIYSRSGHSRRFPPFSSTSYGEIAGLFGINCGHVKYPYIPGYSRKTYQPYGKKENERAYEHSQQQRKLERDIRNAKREQAVMMEMRDGQGVHYAEERVRERQEQMRKFINETGRTRRRDREQLM